MTYKSLQTAGLCMTLLTALAGCFGGQDLPAGNDEQAGEKGKAADLLPLMPQSSALGLLPRVEEKEVATTGLAIGCGSAEEIYAKIDQFVAGTLQKDIERNSCSFAERATKATEKEWINVDRDWRIVFSLSGRLENRRDVFTRSVQINDSKPVVTKDVFSDWSAGVNAGIQIRFPKSESVITEDCDAAIGDKFVRRVISDTIEQDLRGVANFACSLGMMGAKEQVIDSKDICTLTIPKALRQQLVEAELDRCVAEDSEICGLGKLDFPEQKFNTSSKTCFDGMSTSRRGNGKTNWLDSIELSGPYDPRVVINIFSHQWGGVAAGNTTLADQKFTWKGVSKGEANAPYACVTPSESPKYRTAGLYVEQSLNRMKRNAGCDEVFLTNEFGGLDRLSE